MSGRLSRLAALFASLLCLSFAVHAQTSSDYTQGVVVSGTTATIWFAPTSSLTTWVDVHYQQNGGTQQNLRMTWNAASGRDEQVVSTPVAQGDGLTYSFTYNKGSPAYNTPTFTYTVGSSGGTVATPAFSPAAGSYPSAVTVSLSTATGGAVIHYTTNGTTPTRYSKKYTAPFSIASTTTVKALAVKTGMKTSAVASATYTIGGGTWNGMTTFTLANGTRGTYSDAQVYWAIVGLDWNTNQYVHVDAGGALVPMSPADNGQLTKNGQPYTNYFHSLAQAKSVTIPPINSARLYLSVGSPMYIQVVTDANGHIGYTGPNIENPSDPNIDVTFDFVEMAIVPSSGFYGNTTRVDQFGFPVTMRVQGLGGFDSTVGETETRSALFSEFVAGVPMPFQGLAQAPYSPYRIVAPAHASFGNGGSNSHYLDAYISQMWAQYTTQTLTFTDAQGTFSGHVVNGQFQFSDGQGTYVIARPPTTPEALLGDGALNDPTGQTPGTPGYDKQLQIQAQMCAAINRHIVSDPANWANASHYYPAGQAANWYAQFWHAHSLGALAYGFAYDDVDNQSSSLHTTAPTTVTVTVGW